MEHLQHNSNGEDLLDLHQDKTNLELDSDDFHENIEPDREPDDSTSQIDITDDGKEEGRSSISVSDADEVNSEIRTENLEVNKDCNIELGNAMEPLGGTSDGELYGNTTERQ